MSRGFRVWDIENEEYRNGDDVLLRCDGSAISRYALGALDTDMPVNVIIERDTGLKDKNGKMICEGDIVEYDWYILSGKPAYRVKEQVVFDDMGARVGNDRIRNCSNVEVIGNIHENLELLGGKE